MRFPTLVLDGVPILKQLYLEEALLRADHRSLCLLNSGSSDAIVMGISGKTAELIDERGVSAANIPVIKRFSGGGTVLVDAHTLFVTLICNTEDVPIPPFPREILEWCAHLYTPIFPGMELRENDFVFGEKKFGGNALYIQRGRWLLHTSFLWDYSPSKMAYLTLPKRRPTYRGERKHTDFLCTLKERFSSKEALIERIRAHLSSSILSLEEGEKILKRPHRRATRLLDTNGELR